MESLKIEKKITSDKLEELNQFKGKIVEIIILVKSVSVEKKKVGIKWLEKIKGSCPKLPDGMEFQNRIRKEWDNR